MHNKLVLLFTMFALGCDRVFPQCSDAGACSLSHVSEGAQHWLSMDYSFGKSAKSDDLKFHSLTVSADLHLFDDTRVSVSVPYNSQSGPLGKTSGIADATIVWAQTLVRGEDGDLIAQLGGKFATGEDNAEGLPQAYQSGLGTNDLLAGLTFKYGGWSFTGAFQQPFGRSHNSVDRLKRGSDLLVGAGFTQHIEAFTVGGDVLLIQRLAKSSILSSVTSASETFVTVPGSAQSQINVVGRGTYSFSSNTRLQGTFALPLLKREINVDGLTRSISLSIGMSTAL